MEEQITLKSNTAQEEAIRTTDGPLLIISCPGSGKTTTLIRRIHHLIGQGIKPSSILMVTFTNAAAEDMQKKYRVLYGRNPGVTFQTIHSLCFNILRMEHRFDTGDILKTQEARNFFLNELRRYHWVSDPWELSKSIMTEISSIRNNDIPISGYVPASCSNPAFTNLYEGYAAYKADRHKIDFDDMLLECRNLLKFSPEILKKWQTIFRYIQCDEYQDTNLLQRDILYLLAGESGNLCVVGDDDQSIYGFRGANPSVMLNFPKDMKNAKTVVMGTNYRSALTIVETAERLIRYNRRRFDKEFISERGTQGLYGTVIYQRYHSRKDEMSGVIHLIEDAHGQGIPYTEMAVLFRTNMQAQLPVMELSGAEVPFYSTENVQSIYDGWMFADIRSYAKLSFGEGTTDDILRVLNHPQRFLREAPFKRAEFSYWSFRRAIAYLQNDAYWKYKNADEKIREWMDYLGPGCIKPEDPPKKLFDALVGYRSIHYDEYLSDYAKFRNTDPKEFADILDQLRSEAEQYETIAEWFRSADDFKRRLREDKKKNNRNGVTLTTMHKAKGLEWNTVFVIDLNKNIIPYEEKEEHTDIEEERRLLYVAITRAKDHLYLMNSSKSESVFFCELKPGDPDRERGKQ